MYNWLNQQIEEGAVVFRGHRQGLHGDLVGVVWKDHGDGYFTVKWHFELFEKPEMTTRQTKVPGAVLVRLDESVLTSLHHPA